MYISKKVYAAYIQWGLSQSPRSWEIFENFCVKSNLRPTFDCKLQKKIWEQDVLVASPIAAPGGPPLPPIPPPPATYGI